MFTNKTPHTPLQKSGGGTSPARLPDFRARAARTCDPPNLNLSRYLSPAARSGPDWWWFYQEHRSERQSVRAMVAGKNNAQALARATGPPKLPPVPKLRVRKPDRADANPCLGVMSSVLGMRLLFPLFYQVIEEG